MIRHLARDRAAMAAALVAPLVAAAILLPFRASWPDTNVALLLVVVVVAVAAIGSRLAGTLAAVRAAACFGFLFTLPCYRLTIRSSSDVTSFVLLLVAGVAVSQLAARARRLTVIAITDAGCLASARSPDVVADHVREQLISLPGLETCRFEYWSLPGHPLRLEPGWTMLAGHGRQDAERQGVPGGEVELRVFGSGQSCGRLMLMPGPGSRLSLHACLVAVTLADQAGRGLAARMQALITQ
jgi:hypothetical protein